MEIHGQSLLTFLTEMIHYSNCPLNICIPSTGSTEKTATVNFQQPVQLKEQFASHNKIFIAITNMSTKD